MDKVQRVRDASVNVPRQQAALDKIRSMIVTGAFKGGDRLLETSLGQELQLSRTPIREALIILAEEGLLDYRPNRGYVVRSMTLQDVLDAYLVRETLESLACRLIAERGFDRKIEQELQRCLDEGDEILSAGRLSRSLRDPWANMNHRFHTVLMGCAKNVALQEAWARVTRVPYSSSRVVHWFDEDDLHGLFELQLVHTQHHQIFEAIRNREGSRADTAMRGHIAYAAEHIRTTYAMTDGIKSHKSKDRNIDIVPDPLRMETDSHDEDRRIQPRRKRN